MELIIRMDLLAWRAREARADGSRPFPLACAWGPLEAREPVLLAAGVWDRRSPRPPVILNVEHALYPIERPRSWKFLAQHLADMPDSSGSLWLGTGKEQGLFVGFVRRDGRPEPIVAVRMIGPGLERVEAVDFTGFLAPSPADEERWSRHAGALDRDTWLRQRSLRPCVVGVGRTGSAVATTLARWGSPVVLVDPDVVEAHNLDASEGLLPSDIGCSKSRALADHLLRLGTGAPVEAISAGIETTEGRTALADAEVAICCVDNDAARGFTASWARRNGLVLLDIGTGVNREGENWRAGADVRLLIPGEGCLDCWGGLAGGKARAAAADWREERAGSLRTLNQTAAHLGLTLLEQYLAARRTGSAWLRVEIDTEGVPQVRRISPPHHPDCVGCAETFKGEYGLEGAGLIHPFQT